MSSASAHPLPRAPCQDPRELLLGQTFHHPSHKPDGQSRPAAAQVEVPDRFGSLPRLSHQPGPQDGPWPQGAGGRKGRRKRGMQAILSGSRALAQPGPQPEVLFSSVHLGNAFPPKTSVIGASLDGHPLFTPYEATVCNPEGLLSPLCARLGRVEGP